MRGYVLVRPGTLELRDLPRPRPDPDGVVSGANGSDLRDDLKAYLRGHPKFPMPTPFGHEFAVSWRGGRRGARPAEGDAVMAAPTAPCGGVLLPARAEKLCEQVMDTMVLGAYAEYVNCPAPSCAPTSTASRAGWRAPRPRCSAARLRAARPAPLRRTLTTPCLVGAGAIALLHLRCGRACSGRVVARNPARRAGARARAATVIATGAEEARAPVLELTGGRAPTWSSNAPVRCRCGSWRPHLARRGPGTWCSSAAAPGDAVPSTRTACTTIRVGDEPVSFHPRDVRLILVGGGGEFGGQALVADEYPLERLGEALERQRRGEGAKFAIVPGAA
jgi:L-iditol 2-dehydrogenase